MGVIELPCEKIILHNISWETYESLLKDNAENPNVRLFYDNGDLEIMTESFKHGNIAHKLSEIVSEIADLSDIDFEGAGGTTLKNQKRKKALKATRHFIFRRQHWCAAKRNSIWKKTPRRNSSSKLM